MIYTTPCGKTIETTGINKIEFLEEVSHPPHWGWFLFWLIVWFPVIIILFIITFFNKVYLCKINDTDIVRMDKDMYNKIAERISNGTLQVMTKDVAPVDDNLKPYPKNQDGVWTKT